MSISRELVRLRALQAGAVVVVLWALPYVAAAVWPIGAKYFPPALLSLLILGSIFYALLVWRTQQMWSWLFPGHEFPQTHAFLSKHTNTERASAVIGLAVSWSLLIFWVRSVL